jgi:membrane-associated phospholipid phosphatase
VTYLLGLTGWALLLPATVVSGPFVIGMVSFPSFHAASAAIYAWAMWPIRSVRWVFLILNAALIFSTMPEGDHYLTDVIGGLVVAWVAVAVTSRLYRRHEKAA